MLQRILTLLIVLFALGFVLRAFWRRRSALARRAKKPEAPEVPLARLRQKHAKK